MTYLIVILILLVLIAAIAAAWLRFKRSASPHGAHQLFSESPGGITIRSADNLRLVSDWQLNEYEVELGLNGERRDDPPI